MLEKVMEKISFIEVMKDVAEAVARLRSSYSDSIDNANQRLSEATEEDWWKDSYKRDIEEYTRMISAIDKISEALLKLM